MVPRPEQWVDRPSALRGEDQFDIHELDQWLRAHVPDLASGLPEIYQYPKGASNLTYLLEYDNLSLVLRRPPLGMKAKSAHNMPREYRIQEALASKGVAVPRMVALCEDTSVLGDSFYVMQHLEGLILRANPPAGLHFSEARAKALCHAALDQLIGLHSVDIEASGLSGFGKGSGYNRRQIEGWSERFRQARTWNVGRGEAVMRWLDTHCPPEQEFCLIHGDFRFDNLMLNVEVASEHHPIEIRAILDWELATIGDPWMDLGNAMAYWVQADDDFYFKGFRRQPTHLPGMLSRQQVLEYYCERRGPPVGEWTFYEVYGLFRLAVIAQQIYYRYHHGQTSNRQFRHLWLAVNYLLLRCGRLIRRAG